jgi:hypothetical protein
MENDPANIHIALKAMSLLVFEQACQLHSV